MAISVEFPEPRDVVPAKGSAGLTTQYGGAPTTVSCIIQASKGAGNPGLVKKHLG
jgi:hypothetical protein